MVPQQNMDSGRSDSPVNNNTINMNANNNNNNNNRVPMFGSQLVDENSATPYSDATQVGFVEFCPIPNDIGNIFGDCLTDEVDMHKVGKKNVCCARTQVFLEMRENVGKTIFFISYANNSNKIRNILIKKNIPEIILKKLFGINIK